MEKTAVTAIDTLHHFYQVIVTFLVNYSFQVLGATAILLVGLYIARWASRLVVAYCEKKQIDISLRNFIGSVVRVLILVFVVIIALGNFGISVAPFIAAIGAVTLGASLAMQGLLSNYASGLVIILTRPFKAGDTISVHGVAGVIREIKLSCTLLGTEDGEVITIPNRHMVGEILVNSFAYRIVETSVGISYEEDPAEAATVIQGVLAGNESVVKDPLPQVGIQEFSDSAISIGMRYWVPTTKFYQTQYAVNLEIHRRLKAAGIAIPYPQRDVHIVSDVRRDHSLKTERD